LGRKSTRNEISFYKNNINLTSVITSYNKKMAKITKSINGPLSIEVDNDKNSLTFRSLDGSLQANLGGAPTPYDIYNITEDSATVTRVVDKATNKLMFTATGAVPSDAHA
jgi:hypothetical protein